MISEEEIRSLSKKFSIDEITILREYLEVLFLSSIYSCKESSKVFFKGGTSIRLLLKSFRFSEDLDFTSTLDVKQLVDLITKSFDNMKKIVENINLKEINEKKNSIVTYIRYFEDKYTKYPLNIQIEFSIREKPITKKKTVLETLYPITPYPIIVHLDWEEILAEKIRALLKRSKGRDLFDVWYLMTKEVKIKMDLVNEKMKYYNEKISFNDIVEKVKSFNVDDLYRDLSKFLPRTHREIIFNLKNLTLNYLVAPGGVEPPLPP